MTCREFDRRWNERLDGAQTPALEIDEGMESHLENCTRCREASARFEALERAIETWTEREAPEASARLARNVADRFEREQSSKYAGVRAKFGRTTPARALAAAAIVLTHGLSIARRSEPPKLDLNLVANGSKPIGRPGFEERRPALDAVSELGEATGTGARLTSGPAARTGLRAWDSARPRLDFDLSSAVNIEIENDPVTSDSTESTTSSSRLGDRLNARVRAFSASARRAFGFLMPSERPAS
ncbi:MAG: hypothetical protein NVSMB14_13980 [Isosphaeraceae bacterium]